MDKEQIARINELAKKKRAVGLTEQEQQEQQALRRQYIDEFKQNLILTLDNTELAVLLDGQSKGFYAVQEENTLILTPASEGTEWSVNAYALKILNRSGIESLRLMLGETAIEIATNWQLQGSVYGRLTAAGYVSKDYTMYVTENDMIVAVNGENYRINQNYELVGG